MTGLKIVLPSAFSDTSLPILHDDPVMSEGSLVLVDPAHPANPWAAGVPVDAASLPNLAWKEANRAIGSGTQSALAASYSKGAAFTASVGIAERSTKGGLHLITSNTAVQGGGKGAGVRPPQLVADWVVAHPTHSYYFSVWFKMTRFGSETGCVLGFALNSAPSVLSNDLGAIGANGNFPSTTRIGNRLTRVEWSPAVDAALAPPFSDPIMGSVATSGYLGTPNVTGASALAQMKMFSVGTFNPFGATTSGFQSRLLWRAYMEDLTVSGRTYATVDALDYAEYQKQCLTAGGRYYGDTYTTPALA